MAEMIKCPACGEMTSKEFEFCQYCQSRLQPLTGNLRGENAPIKPGELPTKKSTADLEPILPQWLRDARQSARESSEGEIPQPTQSKSPAQRPNAPGDFLAGLQSQSGDEDEEEIPDWLSNITGTPATPNPKKKQEDPGMRWMDLGAPQPAAQEPESELPAWMQGESPQRDDSQDWLRQMGGGATFDDSAETQAADSDMPDWMRGTGVGDSTAQGDGDLFGGPVPSFDSPPAASDTPDWLSSLGGESAPATPAASDTPDWLSSLGGESAPAAPAASDTPDWLSSLGGESAPAAPAASDTPDWLSSLGGESAPATPAASDTPDWLSSLGGEKSAPAAPAASDTPDWLSSLGGESAPATPAASDTPDWLSSLGGESPPATPSFDTASAGDEPDWLSSLGGESPPATPAASDTPDWLGGIGATAAATATQGESPSWLQSAGIPAEVPPAQPAPPSDFLTAPAADSGLGESDSLFAEMPDWLSSATAEPSPIESAEAPADTLETSQLPAWVQAMRPVESAISDAPASPSAETVETQGALAGLQGVLPSVDFKPTSKPKPHSLKLQATEEQLYQAALLDQIIAAETSPVPIASYAPLRPSPVLRWVLAFIFFAATFAALLTGLTMFSLPVGIPSEVDGALKVVEVLPSGAPVLAAFDYEPARAGEMEAAAAPLFDQMAMKGARFATLSTNETGAALAEHFINNGALAEHRRNGLEYVNLGYLPGGQMGIRAFIQRPQQTARFDADLKDAWASQALQGASSFSSFGAFVIVTDNADAARAWIEQISAAGPSVPIVVVSSGQSAPMILPYYASGQIRGLVNGLYGGAVYEQINAGRPGTARIYWDSHSIGMLLAATLILFGGAWNLIAGRQERAAREAN